MCGQVGSGSVLVGRYLFLFPTLVSHSHSRSHSRTQQMKVRPDMRVARHDVLQQRLGLLLGRRPCRWTTVQAQPVGLLGRAPQKLGAHNDRAGRVAMRSQKQSLASLLRQPRWPCWRPNGPNDPQGTPRDPKRTQAGGLLEGVLEGLEGCKAPERKDVEAREESRAASAGPG